jgi:regulator of RNase E activity RraA
MSVSLPELIERYERLSSPVVYDILDKMGYPNQALSAEIRPLAPDMLVAGPAFTFAGTDCGPGQPPAISGYEVFRHIVPHSVLVMATNGHRASGPWGENTGLSAQVRGARGIVIDGGTRDANAVVAMAFPTFCRYVTPVFASGRFQTISFQQPVQVAGQVDATVTVTPGDFVMADRDGVVIVPQVLVEEVLIAAERLEEIEGLLREGLRTGEDREAVYKRYPKFAHVRKVTAAT